MAKIQKKKRAPKRKKYGNKRYDFGYLDRLAQSVGMRHRGDVRKNVVSARGRARMARGMLKRWGRRAYSPIDAHLHAVASVKWEGSH